MARKGEIEMKEKKEKGKQRRLPRSLNEALSMGFRRGGQYVNYYGFTHTKGYESLTVEASPKDSAVRTETPETILIPFTATYKFGRPRRPRSGEPLP
jgi:hypothetical protein